MRDVLRTKTKIFPAPRGALQRRPLELPLKTALCLLFLFNKFP